MSVWLKSRLQFREIKERQDKPPKLVASGSSSKAYRVQGIPAGTETSSLYQLVQHAFCPSGKEFDLKQCSLANDVGCRDEMVAVIASRGLVNLIGSGERWQSLAPSGQGRHSMTLDTRFDGITPLAMPQDSEYLFE